MSWHKDHGPRERRGYHHGNLREALIEAALELISEKGPGGGFRYPSVTHPQRMRGYFSSAGVCSKLGLDCAQDSR